MKNILTFKKFFESNQEILTLNQLLSKIKSHSPSEIYIEDQGFYALGDKEISLPDDFSGVIYIDMDEVEFTLRVVKKLHISHYTLLLDDEILIDSTTNLETIWMKLLSWDVFMI